MLVITRREGEEVVVGDPKNPIGVVRIASIKGDRIRLAFDFPRTIDVHRREVAEQIAAEGQAERPAPEIEVRVKDAAAPA
ncbi:MAG: carbon storage regulator [Phycisphaerales bacterium]